MLKKVLKGFGVLIEVLAGRARLVALEPLTPEAEMDRAVLRYIMQRGCSCEQFVATRTGVGLENPQSLRESFRRLEERGWIRPRQTGEGNVPREERPTELQMYELAL